MMGLAVKRFLCWNLRQATIATSLWQLATISIALVAVVLDLLDFFIPEMKLPHRFQTAWRGHVWKGFLACNIVMTFAHALMIVMNALLLASVLKFEIWHRLNILKAWCILHVLYTLCELAVCFYEYTWYNMMIWRLAWNAVEFLFYVGRCTGNLVSLLPVYSFYKEEDDSLYQGLIAKAHLMEEFDSTTMLLGPGGDVQMKPMAGGYGYAPSLYSGYGGGTMQSQYRAPASSYGGDHYPSRATDTPPRSANIF